MQDMMTFYHRSLFRPAQSTLINAIANNNLSTMDGLTIANVKKYPPRSISTALGHLDQKRKNIQSTKPKMSNATTTTDTDEGQTTNQVFATVTDIGMGKIYTDQTGKFLVLSSRGNKYLYILYDYDSNAIMAEPIKSRTQSELTRAYKKLFDQLAKRGLRPQVQLLDNECPHGRT
jgi:hypothetical protein